MITKNIFPIEWKLTDKIPVPFHGKKAFGTFVCGGGSSMGYKLAGYDHLGGVEFVERYADNYKTNLDPKYLFVTDMQRFNKRDDLPDELYDLDLLDGSPPCSAFSSNGKREKIWRKKTDYQGISVMKDDLVFVYTDTIMKLLPKVFLMENVTGLITGNAQYYLKEILDRVSDEYTVQVFKLSSSSMGIPQNRNRVFIIGHRKKYSLPKLDMGFKCQRVNFGATKKFWDIPSPMIKPHHKAWEQWHIVPSGGSHPINFNDRKVHPNKPAPTIIHADCNNASNRPYHCKYKRGLNIEEVRMVCTFPTDYEFTNEKWDIMGRSVPPVMMANISYQIYKQWIEKL